MSTKSQPKHVNQATTTNIQTLTKLNITKTPQTTFQPKAKPHNQIKSHKYPSKQQTN